MLLQLRLLNEDEASAIGEGGTPACGAPLPGE